MRLLIWLLEDYPINVFIVLFLFQIRKLYAAPPEIINATVAQAVTLYLPHQCVKHNITYVAWIRADSSHIATTFPGRDVDIRGISYIGRLRGSTDSLLTITNVTSEDGGVYTANVLFTDGDKYLQEYNLSIFDKLLKDIAVTPHKRPLPGACSVTCRRNGINVTLTCNQTSHQDITMYDPDTCTCTAWKEDCAPCVLDKYCRKDDGLVIIIVVLVLVVVVVILGLYCRYWKKKKRSQDSLNSSIRKQEEQDKSEQSSLRVYVDHEEEEEEPETLGN